MYPNNQGYLLYDVFLLLAQTDIIFTQLIVCSCKI